MDRTAHHRSRRHRALIISLAVFSCAVAVGLSPARGQGNPGAKRRAPAPPSPEETTLRSQAIHEAVERCAALVEAGDHRKAVPLLAELRRGLAKEAQGKDDSARFAARELPRVDALVARVALDSKAPDKALDFVRPYVEPRDAYNPRPCRLLPRRWRRAPRSRQTVRRIDNFRLDGGQG